MTSKLVFVIAFGAALASSANLVAGAAPGPKARIFAKFDANKNNVIDGAEVAAVRAAYAAEPTGDLARFDANQNGKLDDAEIAEIKPPGQKGAKGGKKEGGKGKSATGGEASGQKK